MSLPFEIEKNYDRIRAEVEKAGTELFEITFRRNGSRPTLTVTVDKDSGVTLDDCTQVSRVLSDLLDKLTQEGSQDPLLRGAYNLEVVSPGLDRPLKTERDFSRAVGERVRLTFKREEANIATWTGKLLTVSPDGIEVELKDGAKKSIALDCILSAQREIQIKGKD